MNDDLSVDQLIENLRSEDWQIRYDAANRLKTLGDTRAVPALINVLDDSNLTVRFIAAMTLGILRDSRAVLPLVEMMRGTRDHDVLWAAAWALSEMGALSAEPLIAVLRTEDPLTRDVAADVLGSVQDERALQPLAYAFMTYGLTDYPETGRFGAADALERYEERAVPIFLQALNHDSAEVRARSAEALGHIGADDAVPSLIRHLRDTEVTFADDSTRYRVCDAVAEALKQIDTPEAQTALAAWRQEA
jgi:HEAT repeat protein